jgi:hypothetical protein
VQSEFVSLALTASGSPLAWPSMELIATTRFCSRPRSTMPPSSVCPKDIETLWLDRGYDSQATIERLVEREISDSVIAKKEAQEGRGQGEEPPTDGDALAVERTNSWLSNFGELRRNTDRKVTHRLAQFALAVTFLLTAKSSIGVTAGHPSLAPIR